MFLFLKIFPAPRLEVDGEKVPNILVLHILLLGAM